MIDKRKYKRLYERIITVWLLIILVLIWTLMAKVARTAEGYQRTSEKTVTLMIETTEPSIKVDIMTYTAQNEAGVYNSTPATEKASETQNITATDDNEPTVAFLASNEWKYYLTEAEIRLVALIAELEDINAMPEITGVILNRVLSDKFPDSVTEVIYQRNQFYAISRITEDMMPSDGAVQAVMTVFRDGVSTAGEAIFFAEQSIPPQKIAKGLHLIQSSGKTKFWEQE